MTQSELLAARLREVILNGTWIANTNFKAQLTDMNWETATKQTGSFHTIAELTFHIHYYIRGVLQVLQGGPLEIHDKYSFDMPPIRREEDWTNLRTRLWQDCETLAVEVENMEDDQLSDDFVEPKYGDYRRSLEGIIEHSYYHLGQVAMIKKLVA